MCWMLGKGSAPFRELEEQNGVLLVTQGDLIDCREEFRDFVEQRGWRGREIKMLFHGITWDYFFEPQM